MTPIGHMANAVLKTNDGDEIPLGDIQLEATLSTTDKYLRTIKARDSNDTVQIDVYNVLEAYNVTCPARQHAIKKLLCAGLRGKGDCSQDLRETLLAVKRAVSLEQQRQVVSINVKMDVTPEQWEQALQKAERLVGATVSSVQVKPKSSFFPEGLEKACDVINKGGTQEEAMAAMKEDEVEDGSDLYMDSDLEIEPAPKTELEQLKEASKLLWGVEGKDAEQCFTLISHAIERFKIPNPHTFYESRVSTLWDAKHQSPSLVKEYFALFGEFNVDETLEHVPSCAYMAQTKNAIGKGLATWVATPEICEEDGMASIAWKATFCVPQHDRTLYSSPGSYDLPTALQMVAQRNADKRRPQNWSSVHRRWVGWDVVLGRERKPSGRDGFVIRYTPSLETPLLSLQWWPTIEEARKVADENNAKKIVPASNYMRQEG